MKNNYLKQLFTALFLLCATVAVAHDFEVDGIYYNILSQEDKTVEVTFKGDSYGDYSNEYSGSVVIPESVTYNDNNYSVTSIGEHAFHDCFYLTSIEIPNSVTSIRDRAFFGCKGLTSIEIPNSVTSIGNYAFRDCYLLTSIEIPNSVTSIGYYAFFGCKGLTSIEIPDSVTSIGSQAFSGCTSLTSIEIPNSVTSIGNYAFYGCTGLAGVTMGNSVVTIEDMAFFNCSALASITIPNSVTSIGIDVFRNCTSLASIVVEERNKVYDSRNNCNAIIETSTKTLLTGCKNTVIPNSVTSIGISAFSDCSGLTSIEIPNSVTSIGDDAFWDCSGLTSVEIPNSVTSIGTNAFYNCSGLTSVEIPNSVTSIGTNAFYICSGLTSITSLIPADVLFAVDTFVFGGVDKSSCTLYVPAGAKSKYASTDSWKDFINIVEIEAEPEEPTIGGSCGENATWTLVDGVLTIGGTGAMYDYTTSSPAPWNEYKSDIKSVVINEGVTLIGNYAFYNCIHITNVTISNSVTSVGVCAFDGCSGLTSVEIPNSVTSFGEATFQGCSALTSITIPDGVANIRTATFNCCSSLTSIEIPNSVTSIEVGAFNCCTGLTSIEIPNSVTIIGAFAFQNCTGLTSIEIPNSVTSIEVSVLSDCSSLTSITSLIPAEELFTVNTNVFNGIDKATCTLYVPAGAKEAYASTGGWKDFANIVELEPTEVVTEVTITIGQYGSTVYSSPYALDFSDVEGLKAYAATGYKTNSQIITLTRVQTAEAGIGVFLKGEPGEYIVPVIESTDEHSLNMLVATLEKTEVNSTSSDGLYANFKYTIKSGDATPLFYRFADGSTLSAGKAYLQIPLAWLPSTASKAINIRFDEGETTDIDELKGENGKAKTIYDLSGRAVENPASGIYIIDGKKVYVK